MTSKPAYHEHEEFRNRSAKLAEIRDLGIEPFPAKYEPRNDTASLELHYEDQDVGDSEAAALGATPGAQVAGRLVLFRAMGKNAFAQLQDHTGRIQVMFNRDLTSVVGFDSTKGDLTPLKLIEKKIDLGDILGVEGHLFRTRRGELTIFATSVTLLCKTLLPLADKHAGLADKELRYRKRWLDLISNPDVTETFLTRSRIIRLIRHYLEQARFVEVETPVLQSTYGGAAARPFTTVLNALDQQMYLRISLEIPLKKLIVGGLHRIYEIGKVFRNEGIDRTHNPEFTELEVYAAYWDYHDMMEFVENLFEFVALQLFGTTKIAVAPLEGDGQPIEIDLKAPWRRMTMKEALQKYGDIDVDGHDDSSLAQLLRDRAGGDPLHIGKLPRGLLIAELFEALVEPHLTQPHHITDHPIETTPLCKLHRNAQQREERLVERFESFILSSEICNSYSELNDPELQRSLLEEQVLLKEQGDEEAHPLDEDFIEAICQGMPPTAGLGVGIDRMVMLFTNCQSIRDVLYFPWMKPTAEER